MKLRVSLVLCLAAGTLFAQAPAAPVKVCIGLLKNEARTSFDVAKLQESLMEQLRLSSMARNNKVELVKISADGRDSAQEEVDRSGCVYVVYTRVLQAKAQPIPESMSSGMTAQLGKDVEKPEIYGLQCTVERTSSGMPILIDRNMAALPATKEISLKRLIADEAYRIDLSLAKKLAPQAEAK